MVISDVKGSELFAEVGSCLFEGYFCYLSSVFPYFSMENNTAGVGVFPHVDLALSGLLL